MGVPKFFRYISERYPCLSELAREQSIPDFDNLYLDMNGIIHNCSHPDDTNIHFNITEEEMFMDIFNYIDKLFFLIKPQKLFFMAIDGVAPRAKMNQQRSRRFRTAKEAETLGLPNSCRGEVPQHDRFDSNCITPGTEFMDRLQEALRYFIKSKISADPLWQKCRVILSGHNCPGEGEHKIMDYIRFLKSQSDFNPNTRHCLYGLDADLIILGLCTHELHFVVLREEVKFGRKSKKTSLEETRFFLLHLGLLREYLELEFDEIKQQDPNFEIVKLIDDWVLMGLLVGNDFIPHLPCLHISSNALPLLYKTYKKVYGSLGGNINENGKLNLPRLEKYFAALAEVEFDIFQKNHADLKYFEAKKSKNGIDEAFDFDVSEINNENTDTDLAALIESSKQFLEDDEDYSDNEQHINDEFENYKRNYYMNKLNKDNSNSELAKEQAICYITALQWILDYYYRGVQSWDWFYPHHYAPFISDLKDFQDYDIKFNMGKPFLPFQQLLAVLPAASKTLLPAAYRDLMTSENSELIEYYPENFLTDLNGKQHEWEAVVLIPFIDEKILIDAMVACDQHLTPNERKRNQHGPMLQYDYHPESQGQVPGIYSLKSLHHVFCVEKPIWSKEILVSPQKTVCVELPNAARSELFPGFPTMRHLKYKFQIKNSRIKVFDYPTRNESMILKPEIQQNMQDVYAVAEKYLHQNVFIGWPHLVKAQVIGISNKEKYINGDGIKDQDPKRFDFQIKTVQEHLSTRMGIEYPDYEVLVHVKTYVGTSYTCGSQGKLTVAEIWSESVTAYPAQGVVSNIPVHNFSVSAQHKKIDQLFPENSKIFFVGNPYYGSEGVVMNPNLVYECGRLKVNITVLPEPDFTEAKHIQNTLERDYVNTYQAAVKIGIHHRSLGRLVGSILVVKGARRCKSDLPENLSKVNIGLQLKFIKNQEELAGYARRVDNQWLLSSKAVKLVQLYTERFPVVMDYLSKVSDRAELLFEQDLFPTEVGEKKVEEIVAWLKEQEHMKAEKVACGSKTMEKESVEKILEAIEHLKTLPVKTVKLQVKPHLLLKPDVSLPDVYKPKSTINLFDRVVIVKTTYMVPLGSKGTVVGVYPVSDPNPVRLECVKAVDNFYEVLFDKHIPNGNDLYGIAHQRVYKVPESSVLLIYTQDDKKNENTFNCKKSTQSENSTNVPITSWRNRDNVTTTNSVSQEPSVRLFGKNPDIKQTPILQKGGEDFWMPAVNTKLKHSNALKILQNPSNLSNNNSQQQIPVSSIEPQQCNDGTQILKSLLGLSSQTTCGTTAAPQFPQPPTSWRADAQKPPLIAHNFSNMPKQQSPQCLPPNAPMCQIGANIFPLPAVQQIIPQYQQQSHQLQFHQAHPSVQPLPHFQQQNPTSAQDKRFSSISLTQKGAFIPLQVSRGSLAKTSQAPTSSASSQNDESFLHKDIIAPNLSVMSLGGDGTINPHIDIKPTYGRKKPPRIPKIGAKFDFAQ